MQSDSYITRPREDKYSAKREFFGGLLSNI